MRIPGVRLMSAADRRYLLLEWPSRGTAASTCCALRSSISLLKKKVSESSLQAFFQKAVSLDVGAGVYVRLPEAGIHPRWTSDLCTVPLEQ